MFSQPTFCGLKTQRGLKQTTTAASAWSSSGAFSYTSTTVKNRKNTAFAFFLWLYRSAEHDCMTSPMEAAEVEDSSVYKRPEQRDGRWKNRHLTSEGFLIDFQRDNPSVPVDYHRKARDFFRRM